MSGARQSNAPVSREHRDVEQRTKRNIDCAAVRPGLHNTGLRGGPGRKFKRLADETTTSPDRQIRIEQYSRDLGDWKITHQFWTFGKSGKPASLLNRNEDADLAGYPAGFRFSPDSQWLVRMQKLGAGYQTLLRRQSILACNEEAAG